MRTNIYTVFDSALGAYLRPFFCPSDEAAMRAFGDQAVAADNPIGQHPECYTLVRIGNYEETTGKVVGEMVESVATALEMVARAQSTPGRPLKTPEEINAEDLNS